MLSERSGVVNIGLEGMMLVGAFFGALGADKTGSWEGGLLIAMAAGGALALIHAFFAIHLRADQIVGGTAINFLALGITGYLYVDVYGQQGTPTNLPAIPDVHFNWLQHVPPHELGSFLDNSFGQMNLMVWLMFPLLIVSYIVMFKTPIGLRIRSVGEHPRAAETVGISVYAVRYSAVVVSGVLAALGGAYLSIGFVHSFSEGMTNGRGLIELAALIFGGWRPFAAFGARGGSRGLRPARRRAAGLLPARGRHHHAADHRDRCLLHGRHRRALHRPQPAANVQGDLRGSRPQLVLPFRELPHHLSVHARACLVQIGRASCRERV